MNGALVVVAPRPGAPGALLGSLPAAERDRAGALHGDRRAEYVGGRVLARTLLAGELGCPPRDVPIVVDDAGRPRVAAADPAAGVSFSLAHAGGLIAVALSRAGDVGVDLEPAGRRPSALAWSCSPAERAWLAGRPPGERPAAFTRLWTRKEACVKARGTGIRHRLADVHCGPRPAGRWRDVWWRDVWVADGFCAAVAITTGRDGFDVRLRHTTLPGRIR